MKYNPDTHHRKSIRLKEFDYSQAGYYFITICTHNREHLFGDINEIMVQNNVGVQNFEPHQKQMKLDAGGKIVEKCIEDIPAHFPLAEIDHYCIMPNHLHLIIIINGQINVGVQNGVQYFEPLHIEPEKNQFQKIIPYSLGSIIKGLKNRRNKMV